MEQPTCIASLRRYPARTPEIKTAWLKQAQDWWRRRGRRPVVLRRVMPSGSEIDPIAAGRPGLDEIGAAIAKAALDRSGGLMNAYVASAIDVALQAEALADGAPLKRVRTPVHDLVAEAVESLRECAKSAGAKLLYDRDAGWSCVVSTDPGRLRKALVHLILRALSGPARNGAVRITVTAEPDAVRIAVVAVCGSPDPGLFDLTGLTRLVRALGGELEAEPGWPGFSPLAVVLPAHAGAASEPPAPTSVGLHPASAADLWSRR